MKSYQSKFIPTKHKQLCCDDHIIQLNKDYLHAPLKNPGDGGTAMLCKAAIGILPW
jgi:hypothetical protein